MFNKQLFKKNILEKTSTRSRCFFAIGLNLQILQTYIP